MTIESVFEMKEIRRRKLASPYIIAEIGVNHEGSIETAKRLIEEAKEGGADAAKFQTYQADKLASRISPAYWDTSKEPTLTQHELFSKHDKFWKKEMEILKRHCDSFGIEFLSTPFDIESATFLNDLMPVFKISSSDITNKPFIQYICQFGKPVILSTGASHLWEIHEAVSWIQEYGNSLALLHCVLNYPTDENDANLGMILGLKRAFPDLVVGYSDHTCPSDMTVCEIAYLLGSKIIEKHFTHDKSLPGNDHYHAMDKRDLMMFTKSLQRIISIVGGLDVKALDSEVVARTNARRSLVAARRIPSGKVVESTDFTFKRPASGVSPKNIDDIVGRMSVSEIEEDVVIQWNMFSEEKR